MQHTLPEGENPEDLNLTNFQKMSLALYNSQVNNESNTSFLQEWQQHICTNEQAPSQLLQFATTQSQDRLTFNSSQSTLVNLEKHAAYYQEVLGIDSSVLQRLQKSGETLQPYRLGSWIEINTLGVNAGWFFPVDITMEELLSTIENTTHKKILTRWANIQNDITCVGYGESLVAPIIRQMEFRLDTSLPFANQFHLALNLADFFDVPPFHGQLLNILERFDAQELLVSLWLTPKGILKFGIRILNPSVKLIIGLFVHTGMDKKAEDKMAVIHGIFENINWVEIQHTSDGLTSEVSYRS